jgi:hypothetical protein
MTAPAALPDRHVLIRCVVQNRNRETSTRFVEHAHYRLWQYLMANKHDLIVKEGALCLWLPEEEYGKQARAFSHAGEMEPVVRLSFAHYDAMTGLCQTTQRFVPAADSDHVRALLISRLAQEVKSAPDFVTRADAGCAVIRARDLDLTTLGTPFEA